MKELKFIKNMKKNEIIDTKVTLVKSNLICTSVRLISTEFSPTRSSLELVFSKKVCLVFGNNNSIVLVSDWHWKRKGSLNVSFPSDGLWYFNQASAAELNLCIMFIFLKPTFAPPVEQSN